MSVNDQGLILFFNPLSYCSYLKLALPSRRIQEDWGPRKLHQAGRSCFCRTCKPGPQKPMEVPWEWSPPFVHSGKRYICSILSRSFCSACQSPAYPSTKGGSLSHPGSGEYFQRVVALSSSLAASDHNKLCTALWDCDTRRWKSSRGGWKSIIWNFCFFFLPDSMLLLCCRLPPSLPPIYCFEGFVSDSSFLIQLLSLFVTLFLPSLGSPSLLDLVCSSLLFLLCQAFALLSFLSPSLIVSHNTDKQVLFVSAFFGVVLRTCRFPFRIGVLTVWAIHSSPQTSKHMSGGVPGLVTTGDNPSNQKSCSLKTAQTYLCPVDLLPQHLYAYATHFRAFKIINFSLRIGLIQRASVLTDAVPHSIHPCPSLD